MNKQVEMQTTVKPEAVVQDGVAGGSNKPARHAFFKKSEAIFVVIALIVLTVLGSCRMACRRGGEYSGSTPAIKCEVGHVDIGD